MEPYLLKLCNILQGRFHVPIVSPGFAAVGTISLGQGVSTSRELFNLVKNLPVQ